MITIEDIALEVGCSVNTVSRALNNKPDVSPVTRQRVLAAADRLGYVPNTLAKSLVTRSSGSIGVIVPSLVNPLYARIVAAVEAEARQRQQSVLLGQSGNDSATEKAVADYLYSRRVDGILLIPCSDAPDHLDSLQKPSLPVVQLLYESTGVGQFPYVGCLVKQAVAATVDHLVAQGKTNLVVVESTPNSVTSRLYRQGVAAALAALTAQPRIRKISAAAEVFDGYAVTRRLLAADATVDGIILGNDLVAPGVIAALKELGRDCPRDVAVVGFGNLEFADYLPSPLTSVEVYPDSIGREAVRLLWELIAAPAAAELAAPPAKITRTELVVRASSSLSRALAQKATAEDNQLLLLAPLSEV